MVSSPVTVVMPRLGESIVEGTIVRWRVRTGDAVTRGQILAEVETDKATSEIPSPEDGTVARILVPEGSTVDVGVTLLELSLDGASAPRTEPEPLPAPAQQPRTATTRPSVPLPGFSAAPHQPGNATTPPSGPLPGSSAPTPQSSRLPTHRLAPRPVDAAGGPVRSSPAVRRLARRHAVDIQALAGSGRGGRVTRDDVLNALNAPATRQSLEVPSLVPVARAEERTPFPSQLPQQPALAKSAFTPPTYRPSPVDQTVPFSRRRAQIADHMVYSLGTAAHVAAVTEIDVSRVLKAREADAERARGMGIKLTFMPYVVAAVAKALVEHPELNATVVDRALVLRGERNIGVAVDTPEGLVVPVIRHADELGVFGIARAIDELSTRAREGKLKPDDVSAGTFTISNPGRDGNLFGVSIIRQPEVGILRLGALVKRAVVREIDGEDAIVIRPIMYAALSYDHRVIDGRTGNAFLARLAHLVSATRPASGE